MNALGTFHKGHLFILHSYLISAFDCRFYILEGSKTNLTLFNPGKGPKFPQNLRPIRLLSTTGKLCEKVILKTVQSHAEEKKMVMSVCLSCTSQHDASMMHEAYRPRYLELQ
jgi:hypothetical protein